MGAGVAAARGDLATMLLAGHSGHPDRPAFVGDGLALSLADVDLMVRGVSAWLRGRGIRPGDVVAIALPDGPEWVAAFLGAVRIGAVAGLVGDSLGADRAQSLIDRAGACLLITERRDLTCAASAGRHEVEAAWLDAAADDHPAPVAADDPCYMLATSGSTGPSKWVVHTHAHIPACIATYGRRVLRMHPGDVTWSVAALPTSYGLGNSLYFPLGAGAAAWLGGGRDPAAAAHACRDGGVTCLYGVPAFWARLARHARDGRVSRDDFAGVRLAVSAGEHLPAEVWRAVERETGMRIVNGLGSSEATNLYLSDMPGAPRAGTVGWPVAGYDLRIASNGHAPGPVPLAGDEGELLVRGPTIMRGYLGNDDATRHALAHGWLHTGDRVRREPDGSYTYLGRIGDIFKAGALWVDPLSVQSVLLGHPAVQDASVLGVEDADGVTRLAAVVAAPPSDDPDDAAALEAALVRSCEQQLEAHLVPRVIVVVDALPATPSGKVMRDAVRDIARTRLDDGGAP